MGFSLMARDLVDSLGAVRLLSGGRLSMVSEVAESLGVEETTRSWMAAHSRSACLDGLL